MPESNYIKSLMTNARKTQFPMYMERFKSIHEHYKKEFKDIAEYFEHCHKAYKSNYHNLHCLNYDMGKLFNANSNFIVNFFDIYGQKKIKDNVTIT